MIESWRWFGPLDKITLPEIAQTGATGIVTALHEVAYGEVWTVEAIEARQALIRDADLGLDWVAVESLPVHEDIKLGQGDLDPLFATYRQSLENLAACGIRTVCYNFMPLLDWTRTTLDAPVRGGATALRFSAPEMAAFEIHMLGRAEAAETYTPAAVAAGAAWFAAADDAAKERLLASIMAGLPGAYARYTVETLKQTLRRYEGFTADDLRAAYARFLAEVVPTAAELGIRLCVHPDDPPRPLLGLPRIVSSEADIAWIMDQQEGPANGLTLCSGSLGANPANDVPAIAARFADRIAFAHLRNTRHEPDGSFQEADHLDGDTDMVALARVLLAEQARRGDAHPIPWRPDHGHEIGTDLGRGTHPGYPLIGRLRGLAELRGVMAALSA